MYVCKYSRSSLKYGTCYYYYYCGGFLFGVDCFPVGGANQEFVLGMPAGLGPELKAVQST